MQINTTARHCEIDPELRALAVDRLERCTRFASDLHDVRLIVTAEKFRHTAEVLLRVNHHEMLSKEEAPEMRVAIDRAIDALEEQLRRLKDRRVERKREGRKDEPRTETPSADDEEFEG
ncbi:MAG: ribosome-associated translation inhibitor RaiA [Candidatus Eisenbacteria bacterium]